MLWDQPLIFFNGPWFTGKTLLMREKAVMWATQNPTQRMNFVVARDEFAKKTSLLEMELKSFFHEQHNLKNVEVLGLPVKPQKALRSLLKMMAPGRIRIPGTSWCLPIPCISQGPAGSWMVDELIMPGDEDEQEMKRMHRQWAKELQQLQSHMEAQTGKPQLWIACAGIDHGKTEHFKRTYLTSVLPPVFHLPEMDVPLRNTKQVLAMAELESNEDVKALGDVGGVAPTKTNPVYRLPEQLMAGVKGKQFLVNNRDDSDELESVVETACKEVLGRTGGAGFPVLCDTIGDLRIRSVRRGVERASATALVYHWRRWRSG